MYPLALGMRPAAHTYRGEGCSIGATTRRRSGEPADSGYVPDDVLISLAFYETALQPRVPSVS